MSHSIGMMSCSKNHDEFCCVGIKVTFTNTNIFFFSFLFFPLAEFGVHLAELTVDPQGALAIRQVSLPGTIERILMVVSLVFETFSHLSRGKNGGSFPLLLLHFLLHISRAVTIQVL